MSDYSRENAAHWEVARQVGRGSPARIAQEEVSALLDLKGGLEGMVVRMKREVRSLADGVEMGNPYSEERVAGIGVQVAALESMLPMIANAAAVRSLLIPKEASPVLNGSAREADGVPTADDISISDR